MPSHIIETPINAVISTKNHCAAPRYKSKNTNSPPTMKNIPDTLFIVLIPLTLRPKPLITSILQ